MARKRQSAARPAVEAAVSPLHLLLVGPLENGERLAAGIRTRGWPVTFAGSRRQALSLVEREPVDVVIAPVAGPVRSEGAFFERLGRIAPEAKKILVLDGSGAEAVIHITNRTTLDYVLTPPLTVRRVLQGVRKVRRERLLDQFVLQSQRETRKPLTVLRLRQAQLELRMKERTAQLSKANQELRQALRLIEEKNKALLVLNESLKVQSTTDPLTGLYNRREFLNRIRTEWGRFKRYARPLSLIMIDIDHFKRVNDTYGHECGDTVLRHLGRLISAHKRAQDLSCRYGGEEFVVLLTETTLTTAFHVAENLRRRVGTHTFRYHGKPLQVRVSMGVSGAFEQNPADVEAFINLADAAMYRAKREGRNRTVIIDRDDPERIVRQSRGGERRRAPRPTP
jgi:diguanylate cyclase (GGDEF)-like protein